jgi:hypothetical protein
VHRQELKKEPKKEKDQFLWNVIIHATLLISLGYYLKQVFTRKYLALEFFKNPYKFELPSCSRSPLQITTHLNEKVMKVSFTAQFAGGSAPLNDAMG